MIKLIFLFISILIVQQGTAQVNLYVDGSIAASGTGASWSAAYKTLNEALNAANSASTNIKYDIHVAQGTYYPTGIQSDTTKDSTFLIARGGIKLLGGYPQAGNGVRDHNINKTILSGNIGDLLDSADNSRHIMVISNLAALSDTVMVDGFEFREGYAYGSGSIAYNGLSVPRNCGAAVVSYAVTSRKLIFLDCDFVHNYSNMGTVYNYRSSAYIHTCNFIENSGSAALYHNTQTYTTSGLTVQFSNFSKNRSAGSGGALCIVNNISQAMIVRNANFSGNYAAGGGGAIFEAASTAPTLISHCSFIKNTSSGSGGAIRMYNSGSSNSSRNISKCIFEQNIAQVSGGAISSYGGFLSGTSCSFQDNVAMQEGGAISSNNLTTFDSSSFKRNQAVSAGAISIQSTLYLIKCLLEDNTAGQRGGGIYSTGAFNLSDCTLQKNEADSGGAVYSSSLSQANVRNTYVQGNVARYKGGAFYFYNNTCTFLNSLITGNKSESGGALYNVRLKGSITNCTFSGNAAAVGNAMYNFDGSSPTILNSIIREGGVNGIYNTLNSFPAITYSIVEGGYTGTGNKDTDPLFLNPLSGSSAPATGGDYRVPGCSPAVNNGQNSGSYSGLVDLNGSPRLFDAKVDMGSYEYQHSFPSPISGSGSVCLNDSITLSHVNTGGAWTSSAPLVAAINGTTGVVRAISTGSTTISYSFTEGPCNGNVTKQITVNPLPATAPTITGDNSLCAGSSMTLKGAPSGGAWSSAQPAVAGVGSSSGVVTGITDGIDTIKYTVTNSFGCKIAAASGIVVYPVPVAPSIAGDSFVCQYDSVTLTSNTPGGIWSSANKNWATVDSTTGKVLAKSSGAVTIEYTVRNNWGCASKSGKQLTLGAVPNVYPISGDNIVCLDDTIHLYSNTSKGIIASSDPSVATIDSATRIVKGISVGKAVISLTLHGSNGCSNSSTHEVTVISGYTVNLNVVICEGEQYKFGTQILTTEGSYSQVFRTARGCDSTVNLDLTVTTFDPSVTQTGNTLTANQAGVGYQWIDCNKNRSPIPGAVLQSFTPAAGGRYAVILRYGRCTVTSECHIIAEPGTMVGETDRLDIQIYPNPACSDITIQTGQQDVTHIVLKDLSGKHLMQLSPRFPKTVIDLKAYPEGLYLLELHGENRVAIYKITILR